MYVFGYVGGGRTVVKKLYKTSIVLNSKGTNFRSPIYKEYTFIPPYRETSPTLKMTQWDEIRLTFFTDSPSFSSPR